MLILEIQNKFSRDNSDSIEIPVDDIPFYDDVVRFHLNADINSPKIDKNKLYVCIRDTFQTPPPRYERILRMKYTHRLSWRQIGQKLGGVDGQPITGDGVKESTKNSNIKFYKRVKSKYLFYDR